MTEPWAFQTVLLGKVRVGWEAAKAGRGTGTEGARLSLGNQCQFHLHQAFFLFISFSHQMIFF